MAWDVEFVDEFGQWWDGLTGGEQESVAHYVKLLEAFGPMLDHPYTSKVYGSKHSHMRELRVQHEGQPYRVLYAFDPRRAAVLLLGGDKTGKDRRWYDENVPIADARYDAHIETLTLEGLLKK